MNITRDSKIAGYPARTVRDALKYVGHGQGFYVGALEQRMKLTRAAAQELATALVSLGMIEQYDGSREREPAYRLTRSGAQLCAAQATKRFRRDVVDGELKKLLDRAREVNGETSSYAYRVARITVLGSYLDRTKQDLGDLDVVIALKPRETDLKRQQARNNERVRAAKRRFANVVARVYWPQTEVLKLLKGRSRIIQVADDDLLKEPDVKRKIVFRGSLP